MILVDLAMLGLILALCWSGYRRRRPWLEFLVLMLMQMGRGRSALMQLLGFGPITVGWLLMCHWINTHGWHGTAAGLVLLAMTVGLALMRGFEEMQKWEKGSCDSLQ